MNNIFVAEGGAKGMGRLAVFYAAVDQIQVHEGFPEMFQALELSGICVFDVSHNGSPGRVLVS